MIGIIDYGAGNVQALLTMFKRLNVNVFNARCADDLTKATRLILPGVGSFDHAISLLQHSGMSHKIEEMVLCHKIPILGICVGMQMLASKSDEGELPGLNWIPGYVRKFSKNPYTQGLPMPHMGWNDVNYHAEHPLFKGFEDEARFYFLHSYYYDTVNKDNVVATAHYGFKFDCVISNENVYGIQCHPEKSHHFGAQFLKNFSEI